MSSSNLTTGSEAGKHILSPYGGTTSASHSFSTAQAMTACDAPSAGIVFVPADGEPRPSAINCTGTETGLLVQNLIWNSIAENSHRAFRADIAHFEQWGGSIPSSELEVASYLAEHTISHKPATLARWVASLAKAHRLIDVASPTTSELVRATMRGIRRTVGTVQKEAKPLMKEDLIEVLSRMGSRPKDLRDKALLLIGFAGAFRRSELVSLDVDDVAHVREGLVVSLRHSKTDQEGTGRKIGIPLGRARWCPVKAFEDWLAIAQISEGPIFRPVDRHSKTENVRLSSEAVSLILRQRLSAAGLDPAGYSGHSLRAGLATSAAQAGVPSWKIRQQTGHASDAMLARYVRDGSLFQGNAAGAVL